MRAVAAHGLSFLLPASGGDYRLLLVIGAAALPIARSFRTQYETDGRRRRAP